MTPPGHEDERIMRREEAVARARMAYEQQKRESERISRQQAEYLRRFHDERGMGLRAFGEADGRLLVELGSGGTFEIPADPDQPSVFLFPLEDERDNEGLPEVVVDWALLQRIAGALPRSTWAFTNG